MESQPQNPEFRNNPENVYPCASERQLFGSVVRELVLGWVGPDRFPVMVQEIFQLCFKFDAAFIS